MPSTSIIRAIDIGYGNTKFVIDDRGSCRLFPSMAPRADLHRKCIDIHGERLTTQVWVNGHPYEVGPDATLFADVPILHSDYIETPEFRALFYGALDAMQVSRIDLLVTGLPVHLHNSHWKRLQTLMVGVHTIRPGIVVEVAQVAVVTQPLGGFVAHSREQGRWASAKKQTCLLVDPGFYTLDWMVSRGMHQVPGRSGSVECGVSEYVRTVEEQLNLQLADTHSDLRRIDDGIRCGNFRLRGRHVGLEPFRVRAELKVLQALRVMHNNVGAGHGIDEIVLVGGGGAYFLQGLRQTFPNHPVHLVKDPVFANVRGFHLIGKILQKQGVAG